MNVKRRKRKRKKKTWFGDALTEMIIHAFETVRHCRGISNAGDIQTLDKMQNVGYTCHLHPGITHTITQTRHLHWNTRQPMGLQREVSAFVFSSSPSPGLEEQKLFSVEGFYFIIRSVNAHFYAKWIVGDKDWSPQPTGYLKAAFHILINCQILLLTFLRSDLIFWLIE